MLPATVPQMVLLMNFVVLLFVFVGASKVMLKAITLKSILLLLGKPKQQLWPLKSNEFQWQGSETNATITDNRNHHAMASGHLFIHAVIMTKPNLLKTWGGVRWHPNATIAANQNHHAMATWSLFIHPFCHHDQAKAWGGVLWHPNATTKKEWV